MRVVEDYAERVLIVNIHPARRLEERRVEGAQTVADIFQPNAHVQCQRRRKHRPRVLLLSPDGCVVGFTTGIRAFSWNEVARFEEGMAPEGYEDVGICAL